jgi:hypothetical protein
MIAGSKEILEDSVRLHLASTGFRESIIAS